MWRMGTTSPRQPERDPPAIEAEPPFHSLSTESSSAPANTIQTHRPSAAIMPLSWTMTTVTNVFAA